MKVIELRSENVKKIKAVEIKPKENVVVISGKNGQGKTSVLDSIWYALDGKTSLKNTPMPIRKGQKKAEIQIVIDDFIVTRNWTDNDKTYLKVTDGKGRTYSSPQELLNSFIGQLTFDPLEFAQMKEKDQRELLLRVANIDIDNYDISIKTTFEERTIKGREVKLLTGEREPITIEDLPEKAISVTDINNELQEAMVTNTKIDDTIRKQEESLKEMERLKDVIVSCDNYIQSHEKIPIESLKEKLSNSQEINEQVRAKERNRIAEGKENKAREEYSELTGRIEGLEKEKATILSNATMPIEGLGISDDGVTYNSLPFGQLSSSEQLKVSLGIAMALNPKLKVIRITDGSLLDDDNMEAIKKLAEEKDFQIWIEKVDSSGTIGFYIEDGEVKYDNDDVPF